MCIRDRKSGDGEKNRNWCFANTFYLAVAVSSICKCIVPCPVNVNCTINIKQTLCKTQDKLQLICRMYIRYNPNLKKHK